MNQSPIVPAATPLDHLRVVHVITIINRLVYYFIYWKQLKLFYPLVDGFCPSQREQSSDNTRDGRCR
jgi:hypothetical protein